MKLGITSLLAASLATAAGCDVYVHPRPVAEVEIGPEAPVVYDSYYVGGHYEGGFWVWRDREGHLFRERREFHERRVVHPEHRAVEVEHHEERRY
jgi:hypothetical protein